VGKPIFRRSHTPPVDTTADGPEQLPPKKARGLFKALANTRLWRTTTETPTYAGEVTRLYREVFTPTLPKTNLKDFSGRQDTIASITRSIEEEQAHVLLLGRQGQGKTSMLNVISEAAREAGFLVARVACTSDLTFDDFLRAVFDDLSRHAAEAAASEALLRQVGVERLSDLIDESPQNVQSALRAFSAIASQRLLVLIDDFHKVHDQTLRDRLADLLGTLNDAGATTSMLIAARHNDDQQSLFGLEEEPSGTVAVTLEPMCSDDIADILRRGGGRLGIHFGDDVLQSIVLLCQGSPAIAQWLGLLTARRVLHRYGDTVDMQDVVDAAVEAAVRLDPYACKRLDLARSGRNGTPDFENIIYLAARISGESGNFAPAEINREAAFLGMAPYAETGLHRLLHRQTAESKPMVEKLDAREGRRYRFVDPQVSSVIMLRNAHRELPSDGEVLNAYLLHQSLSLPDASADRDRDFRNWLQFVLTEDESRQFASHEDNLHMDLPAFRDRYRHADGADDLLALLRDIRKFLARTGTGSDTSPKPFKESAA